ncbi:MAG: hypothetical protein HYV09_34140 [Deltaproteobacteria bacterium]|nr:hypothetical protein [Deltaproteobacteria bacterium]
MALLCGYDFPGNVRELKNALEHAVIMARGEAVGAADLPRSIRESQPAPKPRARSKTLVEMREAWVAPHERKYLTELLSEHEGRVREAAKAAGVNYVTMYRLMKKHGLAIRRAVS